MSDRVRASLPGFIVWTLFLLLAVNLIIFSRTGFLESFLMILFAVFSAVIATEGVHEILGNRPIGTLKEFSSMSREELSLYDQKRISTVNGVLHIISGCIISSSLFQRSVFFRGIRIGALFQVPDIFGDNLGSRKLLGKLRKILQDRRGEEGQKGTWYGRSGKDDLLAIRVHRCLIRSCAPF